MDSKTLLLDTHDHLRSNEMLWQFLTSNDGAAIRIEMSKVSEVSAAQLQLLISAQKQHVADGAPMILAGMTEAFRNGLVRLGLPADYFEEERP